LLFNFLDVAEASIQVNETSCNCNPLRSSVEDTFTLRHVRQILKLLQLDQEPDPDIETHRFDAKIEVTAAQVKTMQRFIRDQNKKKSNKERLGLLHDVDLIINNLIVYVEQEQDKDFLDVAQDYTSKFNYYLPSSQDLFWCILFGTGLGLIYLLWIGLPIWKWFLLLLALSSLWHWGHMYKKAVLKKHLALMSSANIPHECFKEKSWSDLFFGANQKCSEYHDALLVDPLWEVTPTMAVAETLTLFIVQPLGHIGEHLGKFFTSLLSELSFLSALPVLLFVFLLILLLAVMMFNYKIRLPFLLASIEPQSRHPPEPQVHLLEQRIQELQQTITNIEKRKDVFAVEQDQEVQQVTSLTENAALICKTIITDNQPTQVTEKTVQSEETLIETEYLAEEAKLKLLEQKIEKMQLTINQLKSDKNVDSAQKVTEVCSAASAVQDLILVNETFSEIEVPHSDSAKKEGGQTHDDKNSEDFEWVNPNPAV